MPATPGSAILGCLNNTVSYLRMSYCQLLGSESLEKGDDVFVAV